ncbi:MAG: lipid-A-disaccharide synthase [Bacteroidales bacterium]|nr:lipid-A-disaccharide synthase [Bacteroidales bacterium]
MKYYLIAGEASGDLHGSNLIKGLKAMDPEAEFRFRGGDLMAAAGGTLARHYKENDIMGFVEVLFNARRLLKDLAQCKKDVEAWQPDVLILIDYPGFNFRMAEWAKSKNIKVFYYIAPKVWAWKEHRVKRLQQFVDRLFIIFPFEIEYFKKWNIDAIYRGNPLIDSIDRDAKVKEPKAAFLERNQLTDKPGIALLAGSRKGEIKFLLPRFLAAAEKLGPDYQYWLAAAPSIDDKLLLPYLQQSKADVKILRGETYSILRHSQAAIIASGTASLEAALIGVPQVVGYGGNPISFAIAKRVVKLTYISLANLILQRGAFRELLQNECTPENLCQEVKRLLDDTPYRQKMLDDYQELRNLLGGQGASEQVAAAMVAELKNEPDK